MQTNTGVLSTLWNGERTEVHSQKKNSLNCIEYSLQGKEMNNLFYALKSSHAVLTQYDYSPCVMYFREISQ